MSTSLLLAGGGILAVAMLSGCGGEGGGTCGVAAPCGGDIVGTWTVTSACVTANVTGFLTNCPSATLSISDLRITGTTAYDADLTYTQDTVASGTDVVTLPRECIGALTCADLAASFLQENPPPTSVTCWAAGSGCACALGVPTQSTIETGTYTTTSAGLLTQTKTGGAPGQANYCVKGTTLTVSSQVSMMGVQVFDTITFTKQ
jgi:hypothetical protein